MSKANHDNRVLSLTTPLGKDFLLIQEISAAEYISELFRFHLHLLHDEQNESLEPTIIPPEKILGQSITVSVKTEDEISRHFNGIVCEFTQGDRNLTYSHYDAVIVPKVWLLTQKKQSRIFQQKSVPQILQEVFKGYEVKFEIQGNFEPRNYCTQYQETDFDFASRLMEEEGFYYFFKHTADNHQMIIANTPLSHPDCPEKSELQFFIENQMAIGPIESAVRTWLTDYKLQPGKVTLWDHKFELPHRNLQAQQQSAFRIASNQNLEIYEYPGNYAKRFDGINKGGGDQPQELQKIFNDNLRTSQIRMQEIDGRFKTSIGTSDCCSLVAGHKFRLFNYPNKTVNGKYVVVSIEHFCQQSPSYLPDNPPAAYTNKFNCISYGEGSIPFRPFRKTPKPRVLGSQTAIVVGPAGEEIFTDKYGRVKVQFHWDREGKHDINSSCWIRVSQPWAGRNWGTICIPRIDQEVIVDYIEGDIDQPIITGAVYNAREMPPYELPAGANTMGFKSNTTKGGNGYNEMVLIDGKEGELIRTHAQKDRDTTVRNDDTRTVFRNRDVKVFGWQKEEVTQDMTTTVKEGNQENHVKMGFQKNTVNQNIEITSDCGAIIIKAATRIILQVGENNIIIDESGVISLTSQGKINSTSTDITTIRGSEVDIN